MNGITLFRDDSAQAARPKPTALSILKEVGTWAFVL